MGTTTITVTVSDGQLIARVHSRGIRIYGATLTPFENAGDDPRGAGAWNSRAEIRM